MSSVESDTATRSQPTMLRMAETNCRGASRATGQSSTGPSSRDSAMKTFSQRVSKTTPPNFSSRNLTYWASFMEGRNGGLETSADYSPNGVCACFPGEAFIIAVSHSIGICIMANRLSKIVTRTGDQGTTGLGDGSRLPKNAPRVEALGDVDELNSTLGVLLTEVLPAEVRACLVEVQHDLFDLGGEIATPGYTLITDAHLIRLEDALEAFNRDLSPLKEFVLPGGSRAASLAHVARSVCRRAERRVVAIAAQEQLSSLNQRYLNRLSDLLFVLARVINRGLDVPDVLWQRTNQRGGGDA